MKRINLSKLFGIVMGLSLILICSAAAAAADYQDEDALLSNGPAMALVKENIQKFTGSPVDAIDHIIMRKSYVGDVYQVTSGSGNVYNINAKTGQIETAMIQTGLGDSFTGKDLSRLQNSAKTFAEKHYANFTAKKMLLVESQVIDHGDMGKEYVFSWNAKSGDAYTLSAVSISYFPDDNSMYYHGIDRDLLVDTKPKVSQADAKMTGERVFKMGQAAETQQQLYVIPYGDSQKLVWMVTTAEYDKDGVTHGGSVIIDAISGKVLSTNPFN
jgi:hypothetical protein